VDQAHAKFQSRQLSAALRRMIEVLLAASLVSLGGTGTASAFDIVEQTYFLNIRQGTPLSDRVVLLSIGSLELSQGANVDFRRWYSPKFPEMRIDFMTQFSEGIGFLWGVSTGEWGQKYRIAPALKLGFILQTQLSPLTTLSISFTSLFGGRLREKTCTADYGDIGGVQEVNCRLAASTLSPSDTLKYLVNMKPPDRLWVGMRFQTRF
jgi:hypothetical protein